jgi:hypothetical protein
VQHKIERKVYQPISFFLAQISASNSNFLAAVGAFKTSAKRIKEP